MSTARGAMVVAAVTLAVASTSCRDGSGDSAPITPTVVEANATMVRTVDGDTIEVDIGDEREIVRLLGIDTPESVKPDSPIECYGSEATAFTSELLPVNAAVRLERDVEARDDYGRLLAYVYRAGDGMFVNLEIVRHGFATLLTYRPNTAHVDELVAAATSAQQAGLGLWSRCAG